MTSPPRAPPPGPHAAAETRQPPKRATFPKSIRLRDRREFQRVQTRGIRLGGKVFLILAMRQHGPPRPARLGITTSRKSGESVQRSRIRRLLREAWRLHQDEFPAGWDFVVIAREGADKLRLEDVLAALRQAVARLKQGPPRPQGPRGPDKGRRGGPQGQRPGRPSGGPQGGRA